MLNKVHGLASLSLLLVGCGITTGQDAPLVRDGVSDAQQLAVTAAQEHCGKRGLQFEVLDISAAGPTEARVTFRCSDGTLYFGKAVVTDPPRGQFWAEPYKSTDRMI